MGQAKRRRQQLGALYGTPEGSNKIVRTRSSQLPKLSVHLRLYLAMSPEDASQMRLLLAKTELGKFPAALQKNITQRLPADFLESFLYLLGHTMCPARITEDTRMVTLHLDRITRGEDNQTALASWPYGLGVTIADPRCDPRHACYSILQKFTSLMADMPSDRFWEGASYEVLQHGKHSLIDAIPTHLSCSGVVASGSVLHRSGSLFLGDVSDGDRKIRDTDTLWLFKQRPDGIYATTVFPGDRPLRPSEVKDMRSWVKAYVGRPRLGKLAFTTKNDSARLSRAIGLSVEGDYAWLRAQQADYD